MTSGRDIEGNLDRKDGVDLRAAGLIWDPAGRRFGEWVFYLVVLGWSRPPRSQAELWSDCPG